MTRPENFYHYDITDWYWIVAASTTDVWSSARAMSVPVDDVDYVAWKALPSHQASQIDTMANLLDVFAERFPAGSLPTYNADARYRKATGGVVVTSLSAVAFLTDPVARNTLASAHDYAVAHPGHVTDWKLSDGTFVKLTEAQLLTAVNAVAAFVQACFTCESTNLTAITGGTLTTLQQIDDAFAAISNVYP
jgi:hypothetical protein